MRTKVFQEVYEWIKSLLIAGILAFLIHTFLFAVVIVSGSSMEPTLHNNERLIMNKIIYKTHPPERGDIVVFHATESEDYIKRVIGLPGETIEYKNDQLYVNGKPIDEPYLAQERQEWQSKGLLLTKDFGPITVPADTVFVLGDNRNNSTDSRVIGPIPMSKVVGKANIIIWPFSRISILQH
ncbi:signal peptidase I [Tepidibacillus fermentans]|uniref:Signal peptidase I n=1 Tax=Tepidibacillus fermentans TaxID=1281767 RepID=A0A4R3K8K3_9BACI|nr:signal peptidase I [Tepidibacillus fermentans]TCS79209.1 type I signal peptidase [Tepidibacillus fermentans]